MNQEEGTLATDDGLALYWQAWLPPGDPEGVLLFVHGLCEHSGRYQNPVRYFVSRGWACYGFDYRGHGKSPGRRVHVSTFDEYLADLGEAHRLVRIRHPEQPTFPVGHSQGGLLTLLYAERNPEKVAGVIVSSPFLGIHPDSRPSAAVMAASKVLSRVTPKMMFGKVANPAYLSRDPEVAKAYTADPLVGDKVSARWATSVLDAQRAVFDGASTFQTRALVMQGGADRLVDPDATRNWVASAPGNLVDYVEWEGYFHELFNEPLLERRPVFEKMEQWLELHKSSV